MTAAWGRVVTCVVVSNFNCRQHVLVKLQQLLLPLEIEKAHLYSQAVLPHPPHNCSSGLWLNACQSYEFVIAAISCCVAQHARR